MMFRLALILMLLSTPAFAQESDLAVDVAQREIDITAGFTGAELVVYGTRMNSGDVALVVRGPAERMVVRKAQPVSGLWIGQQSVEFRRVPLYYDYALSRPERMVAEPAVLNQYGIGLNALQFEADGAETPEQAREFEDAMVRNKQAKDQYPLDPKSIQFNGANLFRASFYLPTTVPKGDYTVQAYLLRDGAVVATRETSFKVAQAGMGAKIARYADRNSFQYSIVCLMIALVAGGTAHILARRKY